MVWHCEHSALVGTWFDGRGTVGARKEVVLWHWVQSPVAGCKRSSFAEGRESPAVVSVLGQSLTNIILVIGLVIAPGASRVVRGTVLSIKQHTFIDAAYAAGATPWRIVLRHILPNAFAPILVIASVWLGNAIVIEAALSFLGLGTPPPTPTWGGMLSGEGRRNLETAPYLAIFPGLAISIVVLAFNMLGDALRDLLDPRLRTR